MNSPLTFPQYADWVVKYCESNDHPFIKDSGKMVAYCFELDQEMPQQYGWRLSDLEAFKNQLEEKRSMKEKNEFYWTDQARNVEAYSVITFWRGMELLKAAIRSLNVREVIPPAVMARSLLELASAFLINSNTLAKTFDSWNIQENPIAVSQEIEEFILRMLWGTRLGNPETQLKQTNCLTLIQKLSKNPNAQELLPTYEYLCEIAHPNVIGNTRFWSHIDKVYDDGSERWVISRNLGTAVPTHIIDKVLWSLGWSAASIRNSFEITRQALAKLLYKIESS